MECAYYVLHCVIAIFVMLVAGGCGAGPQPRAGGMGVFANPTSSVAKGEGDLTPQSICSILFMSLKILYQINFIAFYMNNFCDLQKFGVTYLISSNKSYAMTPQNNTIPIKCLSIRNALFFYQNRLLLTT